MYQSLWKIKKQESTRRKRGCAEHQNDNDMGKINYGMLNESLEIRIRVEITLKNVVGRKE